LLQNFELQQTKMRDLSTKKYYFQEIKTKQLNLIHYQEPRNLKYTFICNKKLYALHKLVFSNSFKVTTLKRYIF
jgi:hypothetical protein